MSEVTNVLVSVASRDRGGAERFGDWLRHRPYDYLRRASWPSELPYPWPGGGDEEWPGPEIGDLGQLPASAWPGRRDPHASVWLGVLNHADLDKVRGRFAEIPWKSPAAAQLFLMTEGQMYFRAWMFRDGRLTEQPMSVLDEEDEGYFPDWFPRLPASRPMGADQAGPGRIARRSAGNGAGECAGDVTVLVAVALYDNKTAPEFAEWLRRRPYEYLCREAWSAGVPFPWPGDEDDWPGPGCGELAPISPALWPGTKGPQVTMWLGVLEDADTEQVCQGFGQVAWKFPNAVQLFLKRQGEPCFRVWMFRDGRLAEQFVAAPEES